MKSGAHHPDHTSLRTHRRQLWTQILLPILIAVIVFIAVIVLLSLGTFRNNGDVDRWAAISTIWMVLPVMILSLVLIVGLGAMIYALGWITQVIPTYSYKAQGFIYQVEAGVRRVAGIAHKPVLLFHEFGTFIKAIVKKVRERI